MIFSQHTLAILKAGGWSESRTMDGDIYASKLKERGFIPHEAALTFLRKFGELEFSFPSKKYRNCNNDCHFNIDKVLGVCDIEDINDFGNCIGTKLCPVGEIEKRNAIVAVAEDGRVFAYYSPFITLIANNYFDAFGVFFEEKSEIKTLPYTGDALQF